MAPALRAQGSSNAGNASAAALSLTIPGTVVPGDLLLITGMINNEVSPLVTPAGWTKIYEVPSGTSRGFAYRRVAQSGDASGTVQVAVSDATTAKWAGVISAWSGVDPNTPIGASSAVAETTSSASHVTPAVTTTDPGLPLQIVGDKANGGTTAWTPPGTQTLVAAAYVSTAAGVSSAIGYRTAGEGAAGSYGGGSWSANVASASAVMATIVLNSVLTAQTARPEIDITTTGWSASPALALGETFSSRIGESTRDDTTYVESPVNPVASPFSSRFGVLQAPAAGSGATMNYVLSTAGGAVSSSVVVTLRQGTTDIKSETRTGVPSTPTLYQMVLSPTEAATITDWTNLRIRVEATAA